MLTGATSLTKRDPILLKLEAARQYLSEATDLAEVKNISDVAASAEVYARRQQLGDEAIGFAHRLKIDALARLGELLAVMPKATGGQPYQGRSTDTTSEPVDNTPTLAELGITKKVSSVAQQLAALPLYLREEVAEQEKTVAEALRMQKAEEVAKMPRPPWPEGRYRVLYADPPWQYRDGLVTTYGAAQYHYPTLSVGELSALPVKELATDNAVLFLWATVPMLTEAFEVMGAWGFAYKTMFVWDKVKHNYGHYSSVRHELLLVGTRGSCLPDVKKLFDSVVTEERTEHSKKPETFRTMIDTLYPEGPRIELFARDTHEGWEAYGNELPAV